MPRPTAVVLAAIAVLASACADATRPTDADASSAARAAGTQLTGGATRVVSMMDACDPASFNAALNDPEACIRNGGVTFEKFIDQLAKHGSIGSWHFAPPQMDARVGQTLLAVNRGGEVHTFTEVEEFGGGIVPILNQLTGNTTVAPECLQLGPGDFIPPGGTTTHEVTETGVERFECCIHPWMRTVVRVRGS